MRIVSPVLVALTLGTALLALPAAAQPSPPASELTFTPQCTTSGPAALAERDVVDLGTVDPGLGEQDRILPDQALENPDLDFHLWESQVDCKQVNFSCGPWYRTGNCCISHESDEEARNCTYTVVCNDGSSWPGSVTYFHCAGFVCH